nr:hypothetical protein [Nonomuraea rhodomycinica]
MDVLDGQRGQDALAVLAEGAAAWMAALFGGGGAAGGVGALDATAAGGAELVEPLPDVLGGQLAEFLLEQVGGEVEADACTVAGQGVGADLMYGDVNEPRGQVVAQGWISGRDWQVLPVVGDLLGELVGGFAAGPVVDADASGLPVRGRDVGGSFPRPSARW